MAQTTQNVSNLQINTVVHTKDANKKLAAFKKLLSSFKKITMPNITASVTGFSDKTKANAESTLKSQNQTVKALDRQVDSYNTIINRQRKSLLLARKIKAVTDTTSPMGPSSPSRRRNGPMGPSVPPGVRNTNRLNTSIERVEGLSGSRGLNLDSTVNGRSIRSIGNEFRNSTRSAAEYRHEIARVTAEMRRARTSTTNLGERMRRLRTYVVAATASMTLFTAGQDIVRKGLEVEGLQVALKAIKGDSKAAAKEYEFFREVVALTGVDMIAAAKGFKQLTASAKGTKLEGQGVHDVFMEVSKQAATLGMTADDTNGVFRAFSQIISKAKVSAEELNSQLGDRMFGAVQIAAKGMNMTTQALLKLVSTGKLTAEEFIPKMMSALKDLNANFADTAELSKRVAFNRFNNGLTDMKVAIFQGGLGQGLKDLANGFAEVMMMGRPLATFAGGVLKGAIVGLVTPIALVVAGLIDITNALTKLRFGKAFMDLDGAERDMISMSGTIFGLVVGLGVLVKVLTLVGGGLSLLASPAIAAVVAIGAVGAALYVFREDISSFYLEYLGYDPFKVMADSLKFLWGILKQVGGAMKDTIMFMVEAPDRILAKWQNLKDFFGEPIKAKMSLEELNSKFGDRRFDATSPSGSNSLLRNMLTSGVRSSTIGLPNYGTQPAPAETTVTINVNDGAVQGLVTAEVENSKSGSLQNMRASINR